MNRATMDTKDRYDSVSIALHWIIAVGIVVLAGFELFRQEFPKGHVIREGLKAIHQPAGTVLMLLVLVRSAWSLTFQRKPAAANQSVMQKWLATFVHVTLHALTAAIPLVGLIAVFAAGKSIDFGLFQMALPLKDVLGAFAKDLRGLHETMAISVLALAGLHALAALFHHYVIGDGVLRSMSFCSKRRSSLEAEPTYRVEAGSIEPHGA